ncbi:hypothetical protein [Cryptosporangium sp. NPDC048952]|uniref:hypothetical protein n=1 Tax=Cryptosporangium sp. NPDC048952 TaxID=3363961 RepID=UPI0037143388
MRHGDSTDRFAAAFAGLLDEAEALTRRAARALPQPGAVMGADDTGLIRVALDVRARVTDVECSVSWRRVLGPAGLAAAVGGAVVDGHHRWLAAWAASLAVPDRATTDRPVGHSTAECVPAHRRDGVRGDVTGPDYVHVLLRLIEDADREMDALTRALSRAANTDVVGVSRGAHAEVVLRGSQVVEIRFDNRWLDRAEARPIAGALREAFADAYAAADRASSAAWAAAPAARDLRALTADVDALIADLRRGLG